MTDTTDADDARRIRAALAACRDLSTMALEHGSLSRMLGALAALNANLTSALERVRDCCEGHAIVSPAAFLPCVVEALSYADKVNEEFR